MHQSHQMNFRWMFQIGWWPPDQVLANQVEKTFQLEITIMPSCVMSINKPRGDIIEACRDATRPIKQVNLTRLYIFDGVFLQIQSPSSRWLGKEIRKKSIWSSTKKKFESFLWYTFRGRTMWWICTEKRTEITNWWRMQKRDDKKTKPKYYWIIEEGMGVAPIRKTRYIYLPRRVLGSTPTNQACDLPMPKVLLLDRFSHGYWDLNLKGSRNIRMPSQEALSMAMANECSWTGVIMLHQYLSYLMAKPDALRCWSSISNFLRQLPSHMWLCTTPLRSANWAGEFDELSVRLGLKLIDLHLFFKSPRIAYRS